MSAAKVPRAPPKASPSGATVVRREPVGVVGAITPLALGTAEVAACVGGLCLRWPGHGVGRPRASRRGCRRRGGEGARASGGLRRGTADAVFVNAVGCHALLYEDTHAESRVHPGTVVVPVRTYPRPPRGRRPSRPRSRARCRTSRPRAGRRRAPRPWRFHASVRLGPAGGSSTVLILSWATRSLGQSPFSCRTFRSRRETLRAELADEMVSITTNSATCSLTAAGSEPSAERPQHRLELGHPESAIPAVQDQARRGPRARCQHPFEGTAGGPTGQAGDPHRDGRPPAQRSGRRDAQAFLEKRAPAFQGPDRLQAMLLGERRPPRTGHL
jgi:hypothetical protein